MCRSSRRSDRAGSRRIPGASLALDRVTQPLLGLLAGGCNGVIALLLDLLPAAPLGRQFVLPPLERLSDSLHLAFHPTGLPPRDALVRQLGLEVPDGRLSLLEKKFDTLSGLDLLSQSLPR